MLLGGLVTHVKTCIGYSFFERMLFICDKKYSTMETAIKKQTAFRLDSKSSGRFETGRQT